MGSCPPTVFVLATSLHALQILLVEANHTTSILLIFSNLKISLTGKTTMPTD